jgi:hypothetical protein
MSSMINWKVAEAHANELRRLDHAVDAHPFARFVYLAFGPSSGRR